MSSPQSVFTSSASSSLPCPVMTSTAETSPAAKSPCPATSARTAGATDSDAPAASLMIFTQVAADLGLVAHLLDQRRVEALGGIDPAPLQEMVHRDHLGDDG